MHVHCSLVSSSHWFSDLCNISGLGFKGKSKQQEDVEAEGCLHYDVASHPGCYIHVYTCTYVVYGHSRETVILGNLIHVCGYEHPQP